MMKFNKSNIRISALFMFFLLAFAGCQKDNFDHPPLNDIDQNKILSVQELRSLFMGTPLFFNEDYNVFGIITTDERSGNFHRGHYLQDKTGAINIRLDSGAKLAVGDSVRLSLKGTFLSAYNNMLQIDSVIYGKNLITQGRGHLVEPRLVTIPEIATGGMQAQLIRLENVQFTTGELNKTYANAMDQVAENRDLEDCDGNRVIVRTSGFANFAGTRVAQGNGSLIAIVSVFGNTWQLLIRELEEVDMEGERCDTGGDPQGSGSFNDPYNVAYALAFNSGVNKWVEGYIVGVMETDVDPFVPNFDGPWRTSTNIILADNPNETNLNKCLIAQLPPGSIREVLNLSSNPGNKGKLIKVLGNLESYFSQPGIKSLTGYWMDGEGIVPMISFFEENFSSGLGSFTAYNILGAQEWHHDIFDGGCVVMSDHENNADHNNEDWLVSPAIDLMGKTNVRLQIREAINFLTNYGDLKVFISADYSGGDPTENGTWADISGFTRPPGNSWTFYDSDYIDLSEYDGQSIHIALKYLSTTAGSATWQVSKISLIEDQ